MPKKIDKKKTKVIKKKVVKKKIPKIVIYTQALPRTKCCTDVEKTGEAYSIPYGFRDLAGTQRLSQSIVPGKPITPVKESISIQTQTDKQKGNFVQQKLPFITEEIIRSNIEFPNVSEQPNLVQTKLPRRTKTEIEESKQMGQEDVASIQYNPPIKKNRKNSIQDLQERYFNLTGENMTLTKNFKAKQFKDLVEQLETRKKKD
jgi:hypothetical protein